MAASQRWMPTRTYGFGAIAVLVIVPAVIWRKANKEAEARSIINYALAFSKPDGWIEKPHNPQSLFLYEQPKTKILLRGACNQVVSDVNPTPELDMDGLTKQFAEVTVDNLGWKATIMETIDCAGGTYRMIRREGGDRTIITGIAVRGNTTVLITMAGIGDARKHIDSNMALFKDYLASTSLTKTVIH